VLHLASSVSTLRTPRSKHCAVFQTILTCRSQRCDQENEVYNRMFVRCCFFGCSSTYADRFMCDKENDVLNTIFVHFLGGFSNTFADRFIGSGIYDIRISVTGYACAYRCSFCIAITSKAHHDLRPKHLHIAPQQTATLPRHVVSTLCSVRGKR
jgi:hypothetical protein